MTKEQAVEAAEVKENVGKWIKKNRNYKAKVDSLIFEKWQVGKKVKESDLEKYKWGKEFLSSIPCSFAEYLRCSIYLDQEHKWKY